MAGKTAQEIVSGIEELVVELKRIIKEDARDIPLELVVEDLSETTTIEVEISDLMDLLKRIVDQSNETNLRRRVEAFFRAVRTTTNHKKILNIVDAA